MTGSGARGIAAAAGIASVAVLVSCGKDSSKPAAPPQGVDDQPAIDVVSGEVGAAGREGTAQASKFLFTDVTSESGLDMVLTSGRTPSTQILEVKGGGMAMIDFDRDGDLDLFIPNGATLDDPEHGPGCRLFENLGAFRFEDVTARAGLTLTRWGTGAAVGDYDADGWDDLYVTCFGPNVLLHNEGDGTFRDVTDRAHVGDARWSTAAAFGDLDADGDLDLYVANFVQFDPKRPPPGTTFKGVAVFAGPRGLTPEPDVLYENLGDGTFRDVTVAAGCAVPPAYGLGCVILDFTNDGRPDIFVGNDSMANFLFVNLGGLKFSEDGVRTGLARNREGSEQATMGIAIGDVNGDALPDVFTSNFQDDTNTLHISAGGTFYDDATRRYGVGMISYPFVGWACGFYDFDHDADEDLVVFNGHVYPIASLETLGSEYLQTPLLFAREATRFVHVADDNAGDWLKAKHCDRSALFGDLDRDGDIDMVVGELNGPIRLLRNDGAHGPWLIVRPRQPVHGATIQVNAGGMEQMRWTYSGGSFLSASAQEAHFGLPKGTERVKLTVRWATGRERVLEGVAVNQMIEVQPQ